MIMAILGALAKAAMANKPQQQPGGQSQPTGASANDILGAFRNPGLVNGGNLPLPVEDRGVPNLLMPPEPYYGGALGSAQSSALMPDRNPYRRRDNAITGQSV